MDLRFGDRILGNHWLGEIKFAFESLKKKNAFSDIEKQKTEINLFDIIGVSNSEVIHSNILAWLLDPNGSHCFGSLFVKSFIDELGLSKYIDSFDDLQIIREKGLDDKYIDILIFSKNNDFLIGIENKIDSTEHSNQLTNYFTTLERDFSYFTNRFYIYLTPYGNNPSKKEWTPCSYYLILNLLEDITLNKSGKLPKRVISFLEGYIEILRRKIVLKDTNIDENWKDIFEIYFSEKGDYIQEYRRNIDKELIIFTDEILQQFKEKYSLVRLASSKKSKDNQFKIPTGEGCRFRFITEKLDLYPKVGIPKYRGRLLHFDFWVFATLTGHRVQRNKVLIVMRLKSAIKGSEGIREKILEKINQNLDLFSPLDKGHGFYSKFLWDLKDFSGIEQMKMEIEKAFLNFLEGDLKEIEKRLSPK